MFCKVNKYKKSWNESKIFSQAKKKNKLAKVRVDLLDALIEGDRLSASRLVETAISERWEA